jgi:cob(I)alamin adenosyltransferase
MDETIARPLDGWEVAKDKIVNGNYDLIVLDEFTYTMHFGWLNTTDVIDWLKANKPENLHLIITGRNAPAELMEYADLVTEMVEVKHPFQKGILAQAGVDF